MRPKYNPILLAILFLALASLACQAMAGTETASTPVPQQLETQETTPTEAPPQTTSEPAVEPATVASQGAGILCVGSGTGLSCLNENGWQIYTDENSDLPNNYLYAGAVCPDGQIAVAHISGVVLFDGTTFKQLPEMDTASS